MKTGSSPSFYTWTSNSYRGTDDGTMGWTRTRRDRLGRVVEVALFSGDTRPSASATPTLGKTTTAYDAEYTTVTDADQKKRRSQLDGLGRLLRVDEPGSGGNLGGTGSPNQATTCSYDALDNLTGVIQGAQTRTFAYDSLSRLTSATNPESGTVEYTYDANGNLTHRSDARGVVTTYTYDDLDRLTRRSYGYTGTETAVSLETTRVDYAYDTCGAYARGRLCSVTASKGTTEVSKTTYNRYDALGRVGKSVQTTGRTAYEMFYGYDRAGNLVSQTYPSGKVVETLYDGAGRLAGVKRGGHWYAGGSGTDAVGYEPHGGIRQLRLGNRLWEQRRYDARLQPTQIGLGTTQASGDTLVATGPNASGLLLLDYSYGTTSNNGNVLSQQIRVGTSLHQTQAYTYDALNRLKTARESGGSGTTWSQTYTYDLYGNRAVTGADSYLPMTDQTLTPRALTSFNTSSNRLNGLVAYDGAGNLTQDWAGRNFKYDGDNRMVDFRVTAGGMLKNVKYHYDGEGRRIKKEVVGGRTTTYVYNILGQLVAEYTGTVPAALRYLTPDHLGSTRVVTGAVVSGSDGGVVSRHDYLPFGEEILGLGGRAAALKYSADGMSGPAQKFTGKERDAESRLDYFGARYFSGAGGRFTSVDPENAGADPADPQSWNAYAYVLNNPLRYTDPFGLWPSPDYNDLDEEQRLLLEGFEVEIDGVRLSGSKLWQAFSEMGEHGEAIQNAFVSITNSLASVKLTNGQTALSQVSSITSLEPDRIKVIAVGDLYSSLKSDGRFKKAHTLVGHKGYEYRGFKSKHREGNLNFSFAPPEVPRGPPTGVDIDIDLRGDWLHGFEVFYNKVLSKKTSQDSVRKILMKRGIVLTPSTDPNWNP